MNAHGQLYQHALSKQSLNLRSQKAHTDMHNDKACLYLLYTWMKISSEHCTTLNTHIAILQNFWNVGKKRSSQDLNLGLLNSCKILLKTEPLKPLELCHWSRRQMAFRVEVCLWINAIYFWNPSCHISKEISSGVILPYGWSFSQV